MFSVIPDAVLSELYEIFDDISRLTPDELTALSFCQIEGSISNQRLQYVLNMHSTDITNLLKRLCDEGYMESDNNGRWTTYKIKQKVASTNIDEGLNEKVDTSLEGKVDTFNQDIGNQVDNRKVDTSSDRKVDTSSDKKVDTSSDRKVDTLTKPTTRLSKSELEILIMKICLDDYVKMDDVAKEINKSVDYLKNKIFPTLIKEDKLIKRFPYTHNHPDQGYKTSEEFAKKL